LPDGAVDVSGVLAAPTDVSPVSVAEAEKLHARGVELRVDEAWRVDITAGAAAGQRRAVDRVVVLPLACWLIV
jgi:hypothetical protein